MYTLRKCYLRIYVFVRVRSIVISRGKIRACEKIEETSVEATTTMAGIRGRIVGERRKRKKGDERTLDGEGGEGLSRAIAFFDIAFSTLGVGIVKNSLAIKERREEKGRVKPS